MSICIDFNEKWPIFANHGYQQTLNLTLGRFSSLKQVMFYYSLNTFTIQTNFKAKKQNLHSKIIHLEELKGLQSNNLEKT